MNNKEYKKMINYSNNAIELLPIIKLYNNDKLISRSFFYKGTGHMYLGEQELAIVNLEISYKKDNSNFDTCNFLGFLLMDIDNAKSLFYLKKSIEIEANNFRAYYQLGLLQSSSKNYDEAIINLKKSINLNKEHMASYYKLGIVYFLQNDLDNAKKCISKLVDKYGFQLYKIIQQKDFLEKKNVLGNKKPEFIKWVKYEFFK
ncbi:tetratricopeptide repeat protein [Flammeovirga sp. OC4]|uniref:tetratricopeptide repeat protein n=1 Tax=Flammeovirga sp. OC4 TaxID=1382345 RepID=UPI0012E09060|nr:tetratricopeptide repeat protein [Flammeovirga sp. OC4]